MRRLAINSGDAFVLVYSVDDPQSFDDLEQLRETILNEREQAFQEASASTNSTDSLVSSSLASGQSQSSLSAGCNGNGNSYSNNNNGASNNNNCCQASNTSANANHLQANHATKDVSPSRHWSLASLFHHNGHPNGHLQTYATSQQQQQQTGISSQNSSICSSGCSSSDNSRRSSISAAEAALKTRRTRRPPMVIVANKYDLPEERHLIDSDEIEALAVIDWNNGFIRASAAFNWNINEIFQQVLKQARQPPTLTEAIMSKRRKSLPPKLPH